MGGKMRRIWRKGNHDHNILFEKTILIFLKNGKLINKKKKGFISLNYFILVIIHLIF